MASFRCWACGEFERREEMWRLKLFNSGIDPQSDDEVADHLVLDELFHRDCAKEEFEQVMEIMAEAE